MFPSGSAYFRTLQTRYGISAVEYKRLHDVQDGLCAVCGEEAVLHVEHSHQSKRIRGLVCHRCNMHIKNVENSHAKTPLDYLVAKTVYPDVVNYLERVPVRVVQTFDGLH